MGSRYKVGCLVLVLGANLLVLGVVALAAAGYLYLLLPGPERIELKRVASPDGAHDAVLVLVAGSGGPGWGSSGRYELYVVEAGEEATDLPRPRVSSCTWSEPEEGIRTCQQKATDQPRSERRLLVADSLWPAEYEVRWQDERTLEFDHYPSGEVFRFGCSPQPRELVRTDARVSSTEMPDDVCAAGNVSPGTA